MIDHKTVLDHHLTELLSEEPVQSKRGIYVRAVTIMQA